MKLEVVKNWVKEHETEIKREAVRIVYWSIGLGVGFVVGKKIGFLECDETLEAGLRNAKEAGYLIFTKPSESGEIVNLTVSEWSKVMKERFGK